MTHQKTFKLYRVTFNTAVRFANGEHYAKGASRMIRASSAMMAGTQTSTNGGSDIASLELVAVDVPTTGKGARSIARLANVSTRHMAAFPAKVVSRHVMSPQSSVRLTSASDRVVTFHIGGAY